MVNSATTAVINAPSRKIFAPMFRARWQNAQNIVNDSGFFSMLPEPYLMYYNAFIRQCLQWSRGFVPALHQKDFFSTGIGYTVCEIIARECMSGGYRVNSVDNLTQEALENWVYDNLFTVELYKAFFNSAAGGNSLFVLTPVRNEVYATAYPIDRAVFSATRKGVITSCVLFNRFTAGEKAYYVREKRQVLDGKAYYRVELAQGTLVLSPEFNGQAIKAVPDDIAEEFGETYGDIEINEWFELPKAFDGLGVYNIKNKEFAVALADMPAYSDSSLYSALDILYSIDYNYTQAQVDMYKGKGIVLIPKQMGAATINTGRVNVAEGISFTEAIQQVDLADDFYKQVSTPNGEKIEPRIIQAALRGEEHKYIRDADLELLASKVGLSSSTLANHLTYNTSKTATEVVSEQDTTASTVRKKRDLARPEINKLLTAVAAFYGYNGTVEINWGKEGGNSAQENRMLLEEYQAGVLPRREYLKKRYPDLDETELDKWELAIIKEAEERQKNETFGGAFINEKDYYGDGSEGEA